MGDRTRVLCAAVLVMAPGLVFAAGQARGLAGQPGPGGVISTIAGGVGGPGRATSVATQPCGVQVVSGSLYVGDVFTVRRISEATGGLVTVAGNYAAGPDGDGGAATGTALGFGTALNPACGTTLDRAGNLVIADGDRVRVVAAGTGTFYGQKMTAGHIYTVAGQAGKPRGGGPAGDRGPAVKANLLDAVGVSFDRHGNLLIADSGFLVDCDQCTEFGSLVRVVAARTGTFYGQAMTAGDIYTVAGVGERPAGQGNGGPATNAWLGPSIGSVRPDRAGNLVIADLGEHDPNQFVVGPSVRVVAARTGTFYGRAMTAHHIYRVAGNGSQGSAGDGGLATRAALDYAGGVAVDGAGNLVVADRTRLRVVAARTGRFYGRAMTAHHIYGVAGTGVAGFSGDKGLAVRARVDASAAAVDGAGNLVLAGAGRVRVAAARSGRFYGRAMTAGHVYTVAGNGLGFSGNGGPPLRAEFADPSGVCTDKAGDLAFTTVGNQAETVNVVMAASGDFFGIHMRAGDLYTVAGNGSTGYAGDGGPARKAELWMSGAPEVAFDASGNLVVADANNFRVRLVAVRSGRFYGRSMTAGDIYTIAGTGRPGFSGDGGPAARAHLADPHAVSADHHGNVLIADGVNWRVRVIAARTGTFYGQAMTAGDIYTVAGDGSSGYSGDGGPAREAGMAPQAVAVDGAGNLIVPDGNERVRVVAVTTGTFYGQAMTAGDIYTIAGNGKDGSSGNGGPAAGAEFEFLGGAAADRSGNVVVIDEIASLVWVVAARTGTFYGQAMIAGDIYIVAGGGSTILADGRPATRALLGNPTSVAVTPAGDLIVTDTADNRLRAVSP